MIPPLVMSRTLYTSLVLMGVIHNTNPLFLRTVHTTPRSYGGWAAAMINDFVLFSLCCLIIVDHLP